MNDSLSIYKAIIQSYSDLPLTSLYMLQELLAEEVKLRHMGFANIDEFEKPKAKFTVIKGDKL